MPHHMRRRPALFGLNRVGLLNPNLLNLGLLVALAALLPPTLARAQDDTPLLRLGLSTTAQVNSNRALDAGDPGSTTDLTTRLDLLWRLATPIQTLDISADVGLRAASGAEADDLDTGIVDPRLRLSYTRRARDAELDTSLVYQERDVFASELQFDPVTADFNLLDTGGTQRLLSFDTRLEMRRRAPFGITVSVGASTVRYRDTTDPDLTDEDRFRAGLDLRFDLNPATRATLGARLSTFEDFGTPEGRRDTVTVSGSLVRTMPNGSAGLTTSYTDTEDGNRFSLSASRSFETEGWEATGTLGLSRETSGDIVAIGGLDLSYELPRGALSAGFDRSVRSGTDDQEEEVTTLDLGYQTQLTPLTSFDARVSFTDRNATGAGDDGQFGTVSLGVDRRLTRDWSLNVGLEHRFSDTTSNGRVNDNLLRIGLRRDLLARR